MATVPGVGSFAPGEFDAAARAQALITEQTARLRDQSLRFFAQSLEGIAQARQTSLAVQAERDRIGIQRDKLGLEKEGLALEKDKFDLLEQDTKLRMDLNRLQLRSGEREEADRRALEELLTEVGGTLPPDATPEQFGAATRAAAIASGRGHLLDDVFALGSDLVHRDATARAAADEADVGEATKKDRIALSGIARKRAGKDLRGIDNQIEEQELRLRILEREEASLDEKIEAESTLRDLEIEKTQAEIELIQSRVKARERARDFNRIGLERLRRRFANDPEKLDAVEEIYAEQEASETPELLNTVEVSSQADLALEKAEQTGRFRKQSVQDAGDEFSQFVVSGSGFEKDHTEDLFVSSADGQAIEVNPEKIEEISTDVIEFKDVVKELEDVTETFLAANPDVDPDDLTASLQEKLLPAAIRLAQERTILSEGGEIQDAEADTSFTFSTQEDVDFLKAFLKAAGVDKVPVNEKQRELQKRAARVKERRQKQGKGVNFRRVILAPFFPGRAPTDR